MRKTMPLAYYFSNFKLVVSPKLKSRKKKAKAEPYRNQMLEGKKKE